MFFTIMQMIALVALIVAIAGFTTFAATYGYQADWRSTAAGRSIMYTVGSMDLVLLLTLVNFLLGPYPGYEFITVAAFLILAGVSWRLVYILYRTQHIDILHFPRWLGRTVKGWFKRK